MSLEIYWKKALEQTQLSIDDKSLYPLKTTIITRDLYEKDDFVIRKLDISKINKKKIYGPKQNPFCPWEKILEIDKIKSGKFDKVDNPIKNAPHTDMELASDDWKHKYSREEAAYPAKFLKLNKFWPPVARVDNVYGDKNIFCTCPSMDEFKEDAA